MAFSAYTGDNMAGKYALKRNSWENYEKAQYSGVGEFDIPQLKGSNITNIPELIGFNYATSCKAPENKAVHFFLDDYQFKRVWEEPEKQMERLKRFRCVCSPDFSIYTDFPKALQIYAHYKKHWVAKMWEENGIEVIPTIAWSDRTSLSWCFDGEPTGGTVAVASVGTQGRKETKDMFIYGYDAMCERLQPETIIFYGIIPKECTGNIVHIKPFTEKFRIARMEMR